MLNGHPQIRAKGEGLVGHKRSEKQLIRARKMLTDRENTDLAAVGFKTKFKDIKDFEAFRQLLCELNTSVIYLTRENHVKWAISRLNAVRLHENTGKWNLTKNDHRLPPLEIDFEKFDRILKHTPEWVRVADDKIASLDLPKLRISYEELLLKRKQTLGDIFTFLGARQYDVFTSARKNTGDELSKAIKNLSELRDRYRCTVSAKLTTVLLNWP